MKRWNGLEIFFFKKEDYESTEFISKYMNIDSLMKIAKVINDYLTDEKNHIILCDFFKLFLSQQCGLRKIPMHLN